jgi:hypothetical protein
MEYSFSIPKICFIFHHNFFFFFFFFLGAGGKFQQSKNNITFAKPDIQLGYNIQLGADFNFCTNRNAGFGSNIDPDS